PRLLTAAHQVDGCLRIDLVSEGLPITRAELMSMAVPDVALLRVPDMPLGQPAAITLTFRPPADPPTVPGTMLKVIGYPVGADLLKATTIEMADITDSVPKPPKVRGSGAVETAMTAGYIRTPGGDPNPAISARYAMGRHAQPEELAAAILFLTSQ